MSGKRDPRANWLDEDPFEKMNNNSKTHTRAILMVVEEI